MSKLIQTAPCKRIFEKGSHTGTADVTNCLIYISFWMEEWRQNPIFTILYSTRLVLGKCVDVLLFTQLIPQVTTCQQWPNISVSVWNLIVSITSITDQLSIHQTPVIVVFVMINNPKVITTLKSSTIIHSLIIWKLRKGLALACIITTCT